MYEFQSLRSSSGGGYSRLRTTPAPRVDATTPKLSGVLISRPKNSPTCGVTQLCHEPDLQLRRT